MKPLEAWLAEYAESHRNPVNRWIHKICVPAIFFSLVGLLSLVRWSPFSSSPFASAAVLVGAATLAFYYSLGRAPFLKMLVLEALALLFFSWLEPRLPFAGWWYAGIFVVAWIGQFVGHEVEGKKPSFFEDLQFLLIGPLWVFRFG